MTDVLSEGTSSVSLLRSSRNIVREWTAARARVAGPRSLIRCWGDAALYRCLHFGPVPGSNRERRIQLRGGIELAYRLNRGDIQGIREVWWEECYRPPIDVPVGVIVDLGANIGLTSVWFAKHLGASRFVCVEPVPGNVDLLRRNLRRNGVTADILVAAVGPADAPGFFEESGESNLGHVADAGRAIDIVSMDTVLGLLPEGCHVDLLKVDIEGAEGPLLAGAPAWLSRVRAIIVEFHPGRVDIGALVGGLQTAGFTYVPCGAARRNSMDFFVRDCLPCAGTASAAEGFDAQR